jgi:hypothetical protein
VGEAVAYLLIANAQSASRDEKLQTFPRREGQRRITSFVWDRAFGTFYDRPERPKKSPTVFNLGYTEEVAKVYPHVAELSGGVATGHPRQRDRS